MKNYEDKYKDALEKTKKYLYEDCHRMSTEFFKATEEFCLEIFPELAKYRDEQMIDFIISIFEVNYPNAYYKTNPINTTNMDGMFTCEIIEWLKSLKEKISKQNTVELDSKNAPYFDDICEILINLKQSDKVNKEVIDADLEWLSNLVHEKHSITKD